MYNSNPFLRHNGVTSAQGKIEESPTATTYPPDREEDGTLGGCVAQVG